MDVHETVLPGVGKKYKCHLGDSADLIIIIYSTGKREVYLDDDPDSDNKKLFEMNEKQSLIVGSILEGSAYPAEQPDNVGIPLDLASRIEWYTLRDGNSLIGRTLREINDDVEIDVQIIACKKEEKTTTTSLPDHKLELNDLIITVGSKEQHQKFRHYLGE